MDSLDKEPSTPGPSDTLAPTKTTGLNMDAPSDPSLNPKPLGHQSGNKPGGNCTEERVIWCNNLDLTFNFNKVNNIFKKFGPVERIKIKLIGKNIINAFVTFFNNESAKKALESVSNSEDLKSCSLRILNARNVVDEDSDYIPKLFSEEMPIVSITRELNTPSWFVASF